MNVLASCVRSVGEYDVAAGAPAVHRGLPGTGLTLVLALGTPVDVGWADGSARAARWSTLSGLHAAPAAIHQTGPQRGVSVELTVAGARALLGVPAAELAGQLLELGDVAPELAWLPEPLQSTPDPVRVVRRALAGALARRGPAAPRGAVVHAVDRLRAGVRVADVAAEVGYSRRRLGTLVRAETGLAPKAYQRVARFEASRRLLGRRPLVEVAAACGYADQAHLAREWSALAGCAPSTWLREELPWLSGPPDSHRSEPAAAPR